MGSRSPLRIAIVAASVACGALFAWAFVHKAYVFEAVDELPPEHVEELTALGLRSIANLDVPVAALLLYDDAIIGRGYNTVLRDGNAGGHAEINALSDALGTLGAGGFDRLDRKRLVLVTTFEPCAMCRGAIMEYRIEHVLFIEPKSLRHHAGQVRRDLHYELFKARVGPTWLQDSLFRAHPGYDPAKDRH